MKNNSKLLKTTFLLIFIFQFLGIISLAITPGSAQAIEFKPQITVGEFKAGQSKQITDYSIGEYIRAYYKYAIGIVGILAAVILMIAGLIWLTAGGNQTRIGLAKDYIAASLTGLLLTLCAYLILATINPELVKVKPIRVQPVTSIDKTEGCCTYESCSWRDPNDNKCLKTEIKTTYTKKSSCDLYTKEFGGYFKANKQCP